MCALSAIFFGTLFWAGRGWEDDSASRWQAQVPFWRVIKIFFSGLAGLITGDNGDTSVPMSARLAGLAALLLLLYAIWRALLHRNAYRPGAVDVQPLKDTTEEGPSAGSATRLSADLTAELRELLSETSLYPPPGPKGLAEASAPSVVDLAEDFDAAPGKLPGSVLRFLSRLRPKIAYSVTAELRTRSQEPRNGITVTVTSNGLRGCRMTTIWAHDWRQAVRDAAYWVVASILPVTSVCRRPPWRDWAGHDLPPALFQSYQEASRLSEERRFDEAMAAFYQALDVDPLNPYLRFGLFKALRESGLYLEALDTIQGLLRFGGQSPREYDRRLWRTSGHRGMLRRLRRLRRRPDLVYARYAYADLLGTHEDLASQWRGVGVSESRAKSHEFIRERLTQVLMDRYWPVVLDLLRVDWVWAGDAHEYERVRRAARVRLEGILRHGSEKAVRLVFQRACVQEMRALAADYRIVKLVPAARRELTWTTVRLYRDLLAPLRSSHAWLQFQISRGVHLPDTTDDVLPWSGPCKGFITEQAKDLPWHLSPEVVKEIEERTVRHLRFGRPPFHIESRAFQDHYNAACVYAVAMRMKAGETIKDGKVDAGIPEEELHTELARLAIDELRKALSHADSAFTTTVGGRRWWMINCDPDLEELRARPEFLDFAGTVYPRENERDTFPKDMIARRMATYDERLIERVSKVMEQTWHRRESRMDVDVHEMIAWFSDEEQIWRELTALARDQARDWTTRLRLVRKARSAADSRVLDTTDLALSVPFEDAEPASVWSGRAGRAVAGPAGGAGSTGGVSLMKNAAGGAGPAGGVTLAGGDGAVGPYGELPGLLRILWYDLGRLKTSPAGTIHEQIAELREKDATATRPTPLRRRETQQICSAYAATWQKLGEWLSAGDELAHDEFVSALMRIHAGRPNPFLAAVLR